VARPGIEGLPEGSYTRALQGGHAPGGTARGDIQSGCSARQKPGPSPPSILCRGCWGRMVCSKASPWQCEKGLGRKKGAGDKRGTWGASGEAH